MCEELSENSHMIFSHMCTMFFQALSQDQVVAVHVDNGFMRKNESQEVEESLKRLGVRLKGAYLRICIGEKQSLHDMKHKHECTNQVQLVL